MKEHIQDILVGGRPMTKLEQANKEIERLENIIKSGINEELRKELDEILKCNQKQASRIDKAIELLSQDWYSVLRQETINKVKDILQGSDKE